jgi:hypothetical protein
MDPAHHQKNSINLYCQPLHPISIYTAILNRIVLGPHKPHLPFGEFLLHFFPPLKQNFIANHCSILKSTMRLSHTASFRATNHKYCSTHSDNTKHTCRDLLLCVSVGERLMARVVFALHNQS